LLRLLQMRRFVLIAILIALVAVPTGDAVVARTPGARYVQLLDGRGVARVRYTGNFFGRIGRGRIVATRSVVVNGCESRRRLSSTLIECRGRDVTFHAAAGTTWRLQLRGRRINASGFVHGCMTLNGVDAGDPGRFRIGQYATLRRWPRTATAYTLGGC
jgi:hypothetical protein